MKSPKDLQDHIRATYANLRIGLGILAIALPILLWVGGFFLADLPLQESMSVYYHSGDGAMRDVFVGILFAVGISLYLYKGYTDLENLVLNAAGIFLVGVALFPTEWNCDNACSRFTLHGTSAVLFFVCIAYVCIFRAADTLDLIPDQTKANWYKRIYQLLGWGLIVSPAIAVLLTVLLQPNSEVRSYVFFVEAVGVFIFAVYWLLKSYEIRQSNADELAIEGRLRTPQHGLGDMLRQIPMDRVDPQGQ